MDKKRYRAMHAIHARYERAKRRLNGELNEQLHLVEAAQEALLQQEQLAQQRAALLINATDQLSRRFAESRDVDAGNVGNALNDVRGLEQSVRVCRDDVLHHQRMVQERIECVQLTRQSIRQNEQRIVECEKWFRKHRIAEEGRQADRHEEAFSAFHSKER